MRVRVRVKTALGPVRSSRLDIRRAAHYNNRNSRQLMFTNESGVFQ